MVRATVESMVLKRIARRMDGFVLLQLAALHQRRVQVQIVRHHRRADDADGHVHHSRLAKVRRDQRLSHLQEAGLGLRQNEDLDEVADADGGDQQHHDGLDGPHPEPLQGQQQQHVEAGDDDRPEQRDVEQQVERDGAAQHLGQVAGADGHFAQQPVGPARPPRIPVAAALRQVLAGDHAQAGGDHLHEDRHQAGQPDHPQQPVLELRAALQVGAPVAGIHVADADQNCRADEGPPLLPEASLMVRHRDRAVHAFQRHVAERRGLIRLRSLRAVPLPEVSVFESSDKRVDK